MNIDFFRDQLQAEHPAGRPHYAEFLEKLTARGRDPHLLWYPSSGTDFRDLLHLQPDRFSGGRAKEGCVFDTHPDVFIHTDYCPGGGGSFLETPLVFDGRATRITARRITPLVAPGLHFKVHPALVEFPLRSDATGRIVLLDLAVESNVLGKFDATILYLFVENTSFFLEAVVKHRLAVSHLVNIRDGSGLGGGGNVNFKFLWYFLGLMRSQYLITDNMGREMVHFDLALRKYPELRTVFADPANKPTILRGIKALPWSNYGTFRGDAHIYQVTPFPAVDIELY